MAALLENRTPVRVADPSARAKPEPTGAGARRGLRAAASLLALAITALGLASGAPACRLLLALALFLLVAGLAHGALGPGLPRDRFGPANGVTLARGAGAAILAAFALAGPPGAAPGWGLALASAGLLVLDGVDGWLARRTGLVSAFGARFDLEVDALTGLVLAALAFGLGKAGAWVLAIGLMRYAFVALGYLRPAFAAPLPPSLRRKAVCVAQLGLLTLLLAPPVVPPVSGLLAGAALALLAWSFARDLAWLARR